MDASSLRFTAPATPASVALNSLLDEHERVVGALRDAERARDFASTEGERAGEALVELERRAARGEDISAAARAKAETALRQAQARASEPWEQRTRGLRSAARDATATIVAHVARHWPELADELNSDADASKARVDDALEEVIAAHRDRQHVDRRAGALLALVQAPKPGQVAASRVEPAVRACEAVLLAGGEAAPVAQRRIVEQAVEA
jgi:hypothetical protein